MEEFIGKLIGKLEELRNDKYMNGVSRFTPNEKKVFDIAETIVKQLAEEYINCSTDTSTNTSIGWIPCSEKMPLFIDNVLVCTKSGGRTIACLTTGKRFCDMYMNIIDNVVAWMPLPPAYVPEERENNMDIARIEKTDNVNHPKHYQGKHECIDEMIAMFGVEAVKHFCMCNVYKYRYRAAAKNGQEDLDKADWYMDKLMELEKM